MFNLFIRDQIISLDSWERDFLKGDYSATINGSIFEFYDREEFLHLASETCDGFFGKGNFAIRLTDDDKKTVIVSIDEQAYERVLKLFTAQQDKELQSSQTHLASREVTLINITSTVTNNQWLVREDGSASIEVLDFEPYGCKEGDSFCAVLQDVIGVLCTDVKISHKSDTGYRFDVTTTVNDYSKLQAAAATYEFYEYAKSALPINAQEAEEIVTEAINRNADLNKVPDYEKCLTNPWDKKEYISLVDLAVENEKYELAAVLQKAIGSERADKAIKKGPKALPDWETPHNYFFSKNLSKMLFLAVAKFFPLPERKMPASCSNDFENFASLRAMAVTLPLS
jgi:hypothetical protein